jgi:hypothetical protein
MYKEGKKLDHLIKIVKIRVEDESKYSKKKLAEIKEEEKFFLQAQEIFDKTKLVIEDVARLKNREAGEEEKQRIFGEKIYPNITNLKTMIKNAFEFIQKSTLPFGKREIFRIIFYEFCDYLHSLKDIVETGDFTLFEKDVLQSKAPLPLDITPEVPLKKFNSEENPNKLKEKN